MKTGGLCCIITLGLFALKAAASPVIMSQPTNAVVAAGQPASVSVTACSVLPLTYEWVKDGVLLPGQTNAILSYAAFGLTNGGAYQVVVSDGTGLAISQPALLSVSNAPLQAWGQNYGGQLGDGTQNNTNRPEWVASNAVVAAGGADDSLYVTADGNLWTMGLNNFGQLGNGTFNSALLPEMVATNTVAVAAGQDDALFVTADGTLWGMGYNSEGQLGESDYETEFPEMIDSDVVAVSAGAEHTLYLDAKGNLWAMGDDTYGELGDGNVNGNEVFTPEMVATNVVAISAGQYHSLYITADGTLWGMGYNQDGELGDGTMNDTNLPEEIATNVVAVSAGAAHSVYITADGTLWAMGNDSYYELGDGGLDPNPLAPYPVTTNVVAAAASSYRTVYLTGDGNLWGAGYNFYGELGNGNDNFTVLPTLVNGGGMLTAGLSQGSMAYHTLAVAGVAPAVNPLPNQILTNGQPFSENAVIAGGDGPFTYQWQLDGTNIIGATNAVYNVAGAQAGNTGIYAVLVTGAYGSASASAFAGFVPAVTGQPVSTEAGAGQPLNASVTVNGWVTYEWLKDGVLLPNQTNATLSFVSFQFTNTGAYQVIVSNTAGVALSCPALLSASNALLRAWGYNNDGQLGDGNTNNLNLPQIVATNVVTAAVGGAHSLYVTADKKLWAMGANGYGQLGNGTTNNSSAPVAIATNVVAVAAGQFYSLFVTADEKLWAMGLNNCGQFGNGTTNNSSAPVMVTTNVVTVAAGQAHSLFITADGNLWAVGNNNHGQLGNGTTNNTSLPVFVASNVVAVAAGQFHSLYLPLNGYLMAMGNNSDGELGDFTTDESSVPVAVVNGNSIGAASGGNHSLFLQPPYSYLYDMGDNADGELGLGEYVNNPYPVYFVDYSVVEAAAGENHSLYAKNDGSLWAMGDNTYGQLGNGTTVTNSSRPVAVNGGNLQAASLARGPMAFHVLAVAGIPPMLSPLTNQTAYVGQPISMTAIVTGGDGPFFYQWMFDGTNISGATSATYTITNNNTSDAGNYMVEVTGGAGIAGSTEMLTVNTYIPPPNITQPPVGGVIPVGAATNISVTVSSVLPVTYQWIKDGVVLAGQTNKMLNFPSFGLINCGAYRVVVANPGGLTLSLPALVTMNNAPMQDWGNNGFYNLGDGNQNSSTLPVQVASGVVSIGGGVASTLFVKSDHTLWGMGENTEYTLALAINGIYPTPTFITNNVLAVASSEVTMYINNAGVMYGMGWNYSGALGDGNVYNPNEGANNQPYIFVNTPEFIAGGVVAVAEGNEHTLFLRTTGNLYGMGYNADYELGNGATNNVYGQALLATNVVTMAAGLYHSLYITADGRLWGMGFNEYGQLGDGTTNDAPYPEALATNVVAASGGYAHTLFVTADGRLWAMGDNSYGELGNGTTNHSYTPLVVASNVVAVAAAGYESLYETADGRLWAMGYNYYGDLGIGSSNYMTLLPTPVPTLVNGGGLLAGSLGVEPDDVSYFATAANVPIVNVYSNQSVFPGQPFEFTATAAGGQGGYTYQWQFNGTNISGATATNYSVLDASITNAGTYSYVASGPYGNVSASATLSLNPLPTLTLLGFTGSIFNFNPEVIFRVNPVQPYEVLDCTNLDPPITWTSLGTFTPDGSGRIYVEYQGGMARFYRLEVVP